MKSRMNQFSIVTVQAALVLVFYPVFGIGAAIAAPTADPTDASATPSAYSRSGEWLLAADTSSRSAAERELARIEAQARRIQRLQNSTDPKQRQRANDQYRQLTRELERVLRKYQVPTYVRRQPLGDTSWRRDRKRGNYPKETADETCIAFIEGKRSVCYLNKQRSTKTECVYDCYEKEVENVSAY